MKHLVYLLFFVTVALSRDWSSVTSVLEDEIGKETMPSAAALIGDATGVLYLQPLGHYTYGKPPPHNPGQNPRVTSETQYDLASLTKVLATTTCAMILYQKGDLDISMKVSDPSLLGPDYAQNGKQDIVVENLLLHNAGFPPDPVPGYWDKKFDTTGCPETAKTHPGLSFDCRERIYENLMKQTLAYPTGSKYIYSDLSFISMMFVVGKVAHAKGYIKETDLRVDCSKGYSLDHPAINQCYYEAFVRKYIVERLNLKNSGFLPATNDSKNIAPTWFDDFYRNEQLQGVVSDENSYSLGGISGHAGFFSTLDDVNLIVRSIFFAKANDPWINEATVEYFISAKNLTQSSRALGWNTNNYKMNTYRGCGNFSQTTFTHTGYTGTQVCCDVERKMYTILLTNRCYPYRARTLPNIHVARQRFNNQVIKVWDATQL